MVATRVRMSEPSPVGVRLQAFLARAGVASRRACESLILEGRVAINGEVASELGRRVAPGDSVALDGKPVRPEERKRYLLLNKPAGFISSMSDPEGRHVASELLIGVEERVYNVGRLDQWSAGLLLFTNDGELASILVHPSRGVEKEYEIAADAPLGDDFFSGFREGLEIDGVSYRAVSIRRTGPSSARVTLVEGKNREIRKVLEHFGRKALVLRRVKIGPLEIGGLPEGAFRELTKAEIETLLAFGEKQR
jgi:23S rRNA pseudouridine2605 synthase